MKRIAVFIATTAGPVRIERITPEALPQSMVCRGRSSDVLPISGDYDDFVRAGSGVILREFGRTGDAAYRLDVSGPIDCGKSWQLGAFVAHAVAAAEGIDLAEAESADLILWCTGTVDVDLGIGAVSHVPHKVAASSELFSGGGAPIIAVLAESVADEAGPVPERVLLLPAASAASLLDALPWSDAPEKPQAPAPPPRSLPTDVKRRGSLWPWLGAAAVAIALGFVGWQELQPAPPAGRTAAEATTPAPLIRLESDRGETPVYRVGESLALKIRLDRAAYVYCFYAQADGATVQILPNPAFNGKNAKPRLAGGVDYALPGDALFPFDLKAAPPEGDERLTCHAADRDISGSLPAVLRGRSYDPLPAEIADGLGGLFAGLDGAKVGTAHIDLRIEN